ncbi:hypothetical protein C8T65DRAFT_665721 [Cerioporus squamosus]|nr:hypothetical protein C8T65DRAFT_665721 [Cerioporus squamosus]
MNKKETQEARTTTAFTRQRGWEFLRVYMSQCVRDFFELRRAESLQRPASPSEGQEGKDQASLGQIRHRARILRPRDCQLRRRSLASRNDRHLRLRTRTAMWLLPKRTAGMQDEGRPGVERAWSEG